MTLSVPSPAPFSCAARAIDGVGVKAPCPLLRYMTLILGFPAVLFQDVCPSEKESQLKPLKMSVTFLKYYFGAENDLIQSNEVKRAGLIIFGQKELLSLISGLIITIRAPTLRIKISAYDLYLQA